MKTSTESGGLHEEAMAAAVRLIQDGGPKLSEEVRAVVGFYQSARITADRAARDVIAYAARARRS